MLDPPKKDTPHPRTKKKPQQDHSKGEIAFRLKHHTGLKHSTLRGLKQALCTPGPRDPIETEPELCLSVSCRGTGQQWTAAGAGALGSVHLGMA